MPKGKANNPEQDNRRFNTGRPAVLEPLNVKVQVRVTPEQKAKFNKLGGGAWVRSQLDKN